MAVIGGFILFVFVILFTVYVYCKKWARIVRQAECMIVERWGRFKVVLKPGIHFLVPFADRTRTVHWRYVDVPTGGNRTRVITSETDRIDMREHVIDFGRQHVITKDTVSIDIDALVYYQITDPMLAVFKIQNLPDAIELLTQTSLRNIVAQITLDDTFSSREVISQTLKEKTHADAERWGVSIVRVEIQNILPPGDIKSAMEKQIKEERERRSTVLRAEGEREASVIKSRGSAAKAVLDAEGRKSATVLRARGAAEAKVRIADAEAVAIDGLHKSLSRTNVLATEYMVAMQYVNALKQTTYSANKDRPSEVVLVPSNALKIVDMLTSK